MDKNQGPEVISFTNENRQKKINCGKMQSREVMIMTPNHEHWQDKDIHYESKDHVGAVTEP